MASYRPICDVWHLARPKISYYGAYPSGFLSRARALLGISIYDSLLHVCSGRIKDYPFKGVGPRDKTVDINPELNPDFVMDVRQKLPLLQKLTRKEGKLYKCKRPWPAILADPPYTTEDATHYDTAAKFPDPVKLLEVCLNHVEVGGRVGILHYVTPRPPSYMKVQLVATVGVMMGYNNRWRAYSVFERSE